MYLDIFKGDAFSLHSLTAAINELPHKPSRLQSLGLFSEQGVATTHIDVEMKDGQLSLVQSAPRGAPAMPSKSDKRVLRTFRIPHLPQRATIMADEVQNVRAFGSEDQAEGVQNVVRNHQQIHRDNIDATIEFHRAGALQGLIKDADGSTMYNLFTEFGVSQQSHVIALATDATKTLQEVTKAKRKSEITLGGQMVSGYVALCGADFFDGLTGNKKIEEAYNRWMDSEFLRTDNRAGFPFGGVQWAEYRGNVSGQAYVPATEAFLVPMGVPDMFITRFAPADYVEAANTIGLPYYSKQRPMDFDKGIELESQSNPISLCTRPRAVIKLTLS